jgi:hypothetical protein
MTIITENETSFYLTSTVELISEDRDIASSWASSVIKPNLAHKWIVGKYVEADNANSNGQYWSLNDLRISQPSIQHTPMNMGHRQHHIVGTYVDSEMMYPEHADMNAYIETASVFWKYYFPDELAMVEKAYDIGALHQSMECVSESVTCVGDNGCGQTFDYAGPMSDSYCEHIQTRASARQLNNPHFLAGGLILPPDRPGWKNASIDEVASSVSDDEKHRIYSEIANHSPNLSTSQWEDLMMQILLMMEPPGKEKDIPNMADDSPSAAHLAHKTVLSMRKFFL